MIKSHSTLFERDLDRLKSEIEAFREEPNLWATIDGVTNSSGNLCLHLCGNLRHFIGYQLGQSGYVRDRDFEFNGKDLSRAELIDQIQEAKKETITALEGIDQSVLDSTYEIQIFKEPVSTAYMITHLYGHLNWHLGQINYLRRMLEP
jgi:hypothetical protein